LSITEVNIVVGLRKRGETIRQFILENVDKHPQDIVTFTSNELGISRQAVNKHIKRLLAQDALVAEGTTGNRRYALRSIVAKEFSYPLHGLREDDVWRKDVASLISELPSNVREIWQYGFTEMLNNAIDHSSGSKVYITVARTPITWEIMILDDGEGIFNKIRRDLNLDDEHHAILELAKGKLTTDRVHHTGEGIFFSSRMFDRFAISSGKMLFSHRLESPLDWIHEETAPQEGTLVFMRLKNDTPRTTKEIFDSFTSDDDYGFTKTVVPVRLAQYGDERLISRSQAKRLLGRFDRFRVVVLDFGGVESIGQAFADEVFRVFAQEHPDIALLEMNVTPDVQRMIKRARAKD
jgi:anti-sigma regulatory factor (Ser/Thr protein kinase)